jgi:hypothetical protein
MRTLRGSASSNTIWLMASNLKKTRTLPFSTCMITRRAQQQMNRQQQLLLHTRLWTVDAARCSMTLQPAAPEPNHHRGLAACPQRHLSATYSCCCCCLPHQLHSSCSHIQVQDSVLNLGVLAVTYQLHLHSAKHGMALCTAEVSRASNGGLISSVGKQTACLPKCEEIMRSETSAWQHSCMHCCILQLGPAGLQQGMPPAQQAACCRIAINVGCKYFTMSK